MRQIININRKWAFSKGKEEIPKEINKEWNFVNLPHTWNGLDGQDGGNDYYRGWGIYQKEIDKRELFESERYYLEINGANSSADVYVGEKHICHHDGGYSAFRADITEELKDGKNIITIAVDNSPNDRVYPQMADFTFYGGLYRDVNIIGVSESHFDLGYFGSSGIRVKTEIKGSKALAEIQSYVKNEKEGQEIIYKIFDAENKETASGRSSMEDKTIILEIENVNLWQGRKSPYLYKAEAQLVEKGKVIDNVSTFFGVRKIAIDREKGFILNDAEYPLRGVSRHQDNKDIGNALTKDLHERDIKLICEMGANTVRLAHYQHDGYFYDLCDRYGLIVWAEIPYISRHMEKGRENTISQMKELILQNFNHPSIALWGLSNEITMQGNSQDLLENHRILNDLCHEMDKSRFTVIACVSPCRIDEPYIKIPDAAAYNHYFGWYGGDTSMNGPWFDNFHAENPEIPIACSEYGCEALDYHTSEPEQGDYTEEYQSYYHEELIKQLFKRKYIWATYVWNMFDFAADARNEGGENGINHKGLVSFDRKYKKDAFYAYKAWLSDEPFVHICSKRYVDRTEAVTEVKVYSNQESVELYRNGEFAGKKKSSDHFFYFRVKNEGESIITAKSGEYCDEALIRKVDKANENYILKESGVILNWFDIETPEGYMSLKDKLSEVMKNSEAREVFKAFIAEEIKKTEKGRIKGEMSEEMLKMLGSFTLMRLTGLLSSGGIILTKERLKELNKKLNKIRK